MSTHCALFKEFDRSYLKLVEAITKGEDEVAKKEAMAWLSAREECKEIIIDRSKNGDLDTITELNNAVKFAWQSLDSFPKDFLSNYENYKRVRTKVINKLCPPDIISRIAEAVEFNIGAFGMSVDIKKLLGLKN